MTEEQREFVQEALSPGVMEAADAISACRDATGYAPAKLWRNLFREVAVAAYSDCRSHPAYARFMSEVWARRYWHRDRWRKEAHLLRRQRACLR